MNTIHFLQQFASPFLDMLMLWLTNLGSEQAFIVLLIIAYLAYDAVIGRRLGIAVLVSFYLNQQLKGIFQTSRPFELEPSVLRSEAARKTALGEGFPSGHAQSAMTFWGLAAIYIGKRWFWLIGVLLILLISLSRIYLGVHWPLDVFGGLVSGLLVVIAAYLLLPLVEGLKTIPLWLNLGSGILMPLLFHLLLPTADSGLLMGALAAYITGPSLLKHRPSTILWRRILLVVLGVVLAFAVLIGSSLLLPEAIKRHPLGSFLRYLLLGYVGTLLTPWLGRVLKLSSP